MDAGEDMATVGNTGEAGASKGRVDTGAKAQLEQLKEAGQLALRMCAQTEIVSPTKSCTWGPGVTLMELASADH